MLEPATDEPKPGGPPLMTTEDVVRATGGTVKSDTEYIVLSSSVPSNEWILEETLTARDPEAAIRAHVEKLTDQTGSFVAIAKKFWKPVTPAVEVVTTKTITLKAAN